MTPMPEATRLAGQFEAFARENAELVDAMKLAGEAEQAWKAFERSTEPAIEYSISSQTVAAGSS